MKRPALSPAVTRPALPWRLGLIFLALVFFVAVPQADAWEYPFPTVRQLAQSGERPDMVGVLALYHRYGFGTPQSFPAAEEAIAIEAAEHPFCLYSMGIMLLNRSRLLEDADMAREMREDADTLFARAAPGLLELSAVGNPFAQLLLGGLYETGRGVPLDAERAFQLYQASAESGFPIAWYNLGDLYFKGKGTGQNRTEGLRLLRQAADAGVPVALYALAQAHLSGQGVSKSSSRAVSLMQTAAKEHNHNLSQYELSRILTDGRHGQKKNPSQGQRYLIQAVQNGNPNATDVARKLGSTVAVPSTYPLSVQAVLTGAAPPVSLATTDQPNIPSAPSSTRAFGGLSGGGLAVPDRAPSTPPASADPDFLDFHQRFVNKASTVISSLAAALLVQMQTATPSVAALFQSLEPDSGKPEVWLDQSFAPENALLRDNPAWASALQPDKTATYAVADLPGQVLPLMEQKRFTMAAAELTHFVNSEARISPGLRQALTSAFAPVEEFLRQRIAPSDRLRRESAAAAQNNDPARARTLLEEASALDLRPQDAEEIATLRQKEKRSAFESDLGL